MTTPKTLPAMDTSILDAWRNPSARGSRKADAGFAELLEVRGKMNHTPVAAGQQQNLAASQTPGIAGRLQAKALASLAKVFNTDPGAGSVAGLGARGLRGLQNLGADKAAAGTEPQKGMALADTRRGIPLDANQLRTLSRVITSTPVRTPSRIAPVPGRTSVTPTQPGDVGTLAAKFESGSDGIAAIGYDANGGTSYGKYQIASRPGSMSMFIDFLRREAPDMAKRLASAGPANTGSRKGAMPRVWRELAREDPDRFEELQERFIKQSHYEPALAAIGRLGYATDSFSPAMREVLFSTAVQHGPAGATRIFNRAAGRVGVTGKDPQRHEERLIREVYAIRSGQFGSSSPQIQAAARRRMEQERDLAMAMSRTKAA